MVLIYAGSDCDQQTCELRTWSKDYFLPYLVPVNENLNPVNITQLFDVFLFLAITSGANPQHLFIYDYMQSGAASNQEYWKWFLNWLFHDADHQLDALQNAAASCGLNAWVMVMIPYPDPGQEAFGSGWNFSRQVNRLAAVKWYINEFVKTWNEKYYSNLQFRGFYWMEENIWPQVPEDERLLPQIAAYIHSLEVDGRTPEFTWISAQSYKFTELWTRQKAAQWHDYGFDYAFFQPNYYQERYQRTIANLRDTMSFCRRNELGIEIEFDENVLSNNAYRQKLLDYLAVAQETGFDTAFILPYYQGVYTIYTLARNGDALYRRLYRFILSRRSGSRITEQPGNITF